jgi:hypothetical protein
MSIDVKEKRSGKYMTFAYKNCSYSTQTQSFSLIRNVDLIEFEREIRDQHPDVKNKFHNH